MPQLFPWISSPCWSSSMVDYWSSSRSSAKVSVNTSSLNSGNSSNQLWCTSERPIKTTLSIKVCTCGKIRSHLQASRARELIKWLNSKLNQSAISKTSTFGAQPIGTRVQRKCTNRTQHSSLTAFLQVHHAGSGYIKKKENFTGLPMYDLTLYLSHRFVLKTT